MEAEVTTATAEISQSPVEDRMEISVKGKWVEVATLRVGGENLIVSGKRLRIAVAHDEDWAVNDVRDPELCAKSLRHCKLPSLHADIFTFSQKIPSLQPRYSYAMEWESAAAIALTSYKEWWDSLPQETRKNVRRSQKRGVVIQVRRFDDEMVRQIVEVNNDSQLRQRGRFAHYGKSFEQVKKDHCSFADRSDFICAYYENEIIGFLKLVYRGNIASILQLLPKASHQDKRPANYMVAKAVELCEAKGITHITYGLYNYGNKRDSPLREFKIRNGFKEILAPRFYVPLTLWGKFCMKFKFHRGLIGILPHSLITLGVNLRAKWYNSRMPTKPV